MMTSSQASSPHSFFTRFPCTIAQDRYAAALGGLEALSDMNYYKER